MNFGELKTLCRASVPQAKDARMSDTILGSMINEVAKDLSMQLNLIHEDSKFTVTAEKYKYDLSNPAETVERFGKMDDSGIYFNQGTEAAPDWKEILPRTIAWLNKNFPNWRSADSGDPMYYAKDGKRLIFYPTPDTGLTSGFWIYYIQQPMAMSLDTDYPFGSDIPEYSILTKAILRGVEYFILAFVNEKEKSIQSFNEYKVLIDDCKKVLSENLDIDNAEESVLKLERVC